jgi:hypothetical protein
MKPMAKQYDVEINRVNIADEFSIEMMPKKSLRDVHSSDGIRRAYAPVHVWYRHTLQFPQDMPEDEKNFLRSVRPMPFTKRRALAGKSSGFADWNFSPRPPKRRDEGEVVSLPITTPRSLLQSHRKIGIVPVGKIRDDRSFRRWRDRNPCPSSSPRPCTRNGEASLASPRPRPEQDSPTLSIDAFNALKRRAMLLSVVPTDTVRLSAEQYVRIEDDVMRCTQGRVTRVVTLDDCRMAPTGSLTIAGLSISERQLIYLVGGEGRAEKGCALYQLVQMVWPNVSSASIDSLMLKYSTSLNAALGGSLKHRSDPVVYEQIRRLYSVFDTDGDGSIGVGDIRAQFNRLQDRRHDENKCDADLDDQIPHGADGAVSLEDFAFFVRFLFPPYRPLGA